MPTRSWGHHDNSHQGASRTGVEKANQVNKLPWEAQQENTSQELKNHFSPNLHENLNVLMKSFLKSRKFQFWISIQF